MKVSAITTVLIAAGASAAAVPEAVSSALQVRQQTGTQNVPGLGARKKEVMDAGANTFDLAIAMLETDGMDANYVYGDNKVDDAANFGIFKQNWGALRACCTQFKGRPQSAWREGEALNKDLKADVKCLNECQKFHGLDKWLAGHRNGESGFKNPDTPDIRNYSNGVKYIEQQLKTQPGALTNDVRYYIYVNPI